MQYCMNMTLSDGELLRRHGALQKYMSDNGIACAIVFSRDGIFKSWLAGEYMAGFAGAGDIIPQSGDSYIVSEEFLNFGFLTGNENFEDYVSDSNYPNVKMAKRFSGAPVKRAVSESGCCTIGIYHPDEMNIETAEYLSKIVPGAVYLDVTEPFDRIRMKKSREEISCITGSVRAVENAFRAMPSVLKAGLTENECINRIRYAVNEALVGNINACMRNSVKLVSSGPDAPAESGAYKYPGKVLEAGDRVDITFHCVTRDWAYGMAARSFVMDDSVPEKTRAQWSAAVGASELAASILKPGVTLKKTARKVNDYLVEKGSRADDSVFLYSLFYGFPEEPCLHSYSETMPLEEGAVICVCPRAAFGDNAPMCCGDVYEITEKGCRRLGELDKEITAIGRT